MVQTMKYLLMIGLVLACAACEKKPAEVPVPKFLSEVATFCREPDDVTVKAVVDDMQKKGMVYRGVLNANGINCNRVLFSN